MNKLKAVILFETILILILIGIILFQNTSVFSFFSGSKTQYCEKNYYDSKECLLSPRIYTKIIQPNSFLILNLNPLKDDIQGYIGKNNFNMSVYILNLRDGASFGINVNQSYRALSLNKLPVAVIILKKIEEGKLTLDTKLPIYQRDRDSSSGTLYKEPVTELSVRELLRYMLSESDNTALNVLGEQESLEDLQHLSNYLGYYTEDINYEKPPFSKVFYLTPKSVSGIFSSLYLSTALEPEDSELILSYLTNTSFDIKKYAQLPGDVVVAQKYGSSFTANESMMHSCGIIYVEDSRFFYCVMTKDLKKEEASEAIGNVVNKLYNFITEQNKINDIGV